MTWRYGAMLIMSIVYLCFSQHLFVGVLTGADFDDALFVRNARSLLSGHWLGPYSSLTLAKGPGYSVFLALNYLLGTSVVQLQSALYAFSCAFFADSIFRLTRSLGLSLAMFAILLWHPYVVPVHVIRDDIYGAQSLLYFGCLARLALLENPPVRRRFWAVAAGLAFAWLWITREEGVWAILPTLVLCVPLLWKAQRRWTDLAVFSGTAALVLVLIAAANFAAYRTFVIVDMKGRAYSRAISALQSVRVGDPEPYVPVPAKVREAVYDVSPAFRSLKDYFNGAGRPFTQAGCPLYPNSCGDYAGGWFMWAFRDGAESTGHYTSASEAAAFYNQITSEVRSACAAGRLHCEPSPIPFMPRVTSTQLRQIPFKMRDMFAMLTARAALMPPPQSDGAADQLEKTWEFLGYPRRTPAESDPSSDLMGWYYAKSGAWIEFACQNDGQTQIVPAKRGASPDVASRFNNSAAGDRRFSAALPQGAPCRVRPAGSTASNAGLASDNLWRQRDWTLGDGQLHIDQYGSITRSVVERSGQAVLAALAVLYRWLTAGLIFAAAAGYLTHLVMLLRRSARPEGCWLLVHALCLAVATRAAILVLVDISSFPGVVIEYVAASVPLFYAALVLMAYLPMRGDGMAHRRWLRLARFDGTGFGSSAALSPPRVDDP